MKAWLLLFIKLLVAGGLIAYVLTIVPLRDIFGAFTNVDPLGVLLTYALTLVIRWIEALQMVILTRRQELGLSTFEIFTISLRSSFYNLFLPGLVAGGAFRWYHFSRKQNRPAESLAAITFNRLIRTGMVFLTGLAFWILDDSLPYRENLRLVVWICLGGVVLSLLAFLLGASLFREKADALKTVKWLPGFVRGKLLKFTRAFFHYRNLCTREVAGLIGLSLMAQITGIYLMWVLARALDIEADFIALGWIRSLLAFITGLPISFSGIGIRETGLIYLLEPLGIAPALCVAFALLLFSRIVFLGALGGLLEFAIWIRTRGAPDGSKYSATK